MSSLHVACSPPILPNSMSKFTQELGVEGSGMHESGEDWGSMNVFVFSVVFSSR